VLSFLKRIGATSLVMLLGACGGCGVSPLRARPDPLSDASHDSPLDSGNAGNNDEAGDSSQAIFDAGDDGDAPQADGFAGAGGSGPDATTITGDAQRDSGVSGDATNAMDAGDAGDGRGDSRSEGSASACSACSAWGTPVAEGPSPAILPELSGLAASHLHPGLLYAHNDSGDSARFFALTEQAHVNAEIHLTGATATDWEDISVGPCPSGWCVYIGDTGDNKVDRSNYVIYRVAEPATLATDGSITTVSYQSFPFEYPNGEHHNAETLLVHPITGQVFIVIKESGIPATVYEMPLPLMADTKVTLTVAGSLAIPPAEGVVTDGSFHPCGDRLLIRTTSATGLFGAKPVMVPVAVEPQGEGITYALDGRRYFTSSETVSGDPTPSISVVTCASSP
jgi:hypothetical protein